MEFLGERKTRKDVKSVVEASLKKGSSAFIFLLYTGDKKPAGVCFFNVCLGVQSGGRYIWINEIFVKEEYRGIGYGKAMLEYLENFAKRKKYVYIAAQRDPKNNNSKMLFNSAKFFEGTVIWMDKKV